MTFAGFWVDGAVRKPEVPSDGTSGRFVYRWKTNKLCAIGSVLGWGRFEEVEWLDTTPRESLTPEELLSVAKVLSPSATRVEKRNDGPLTFWVVDDEESAIKVDWGSLTQYPPPAEPQWIRITRENVRQYLFRECRFRNSTSHEWRIGVLCGWDEQDSCCLVNSDFEEEMPIMSWDIVEVQNAPTP